VLLPVLSKCAEQPALREAPVGLVRGYCRCENAVASFRPTANPLLHDAPLANLATRAMAEIDQSEQFVYRQAPVDDALPSDPLSGPPL
jgi:hypothetical protein